MYIEMLIALAKLKQAIVISALLTATIIAVQLVFVHRKEPYTLTHDTHGHGEVLLLDKALNLPNKSNSTLPTTRNDGAEQQRNGSTNDRATKAIIKQLKNTDQAAKNKVDEVRENNANHITTNSSVHLVFLRPTWAKRLPTKGESRVDNCDVPCFYSGDNSPEAIKRSRAVIFLLYRLQVIPWNTLATSSDPDVILKRREVDPSSVIKVGKSTESTANNPTQFDLISKYDIEFSYRITSDVFTPYFELPTYNLLKTVPKWGERYSAVVFVANNCYSLNNHREKFVKLLQKYVQVDSVSGCLHNKDWPRGISRYDKIGLLERYKVYIAAENSIDKDYVSEKVYEGLVASAVPIYLGAPNVEEYIPSNSAIIAQTNFTENDISILATVVKKVFTDEAEYDRWISFKHHDYEDWFKKRFSFTQVGNKCRLCGRVLAQREGYSWDHDSQQIVF